MITRQPKKGIPAQYRQGDVFFEEATIPSHLKAEPKKDTKIILEHGETTGHYHAVEAEHANLYLDGCRQYLEVCLALPMTHQEHEEIVYPAKSYERCKQLTYDYLAEMAKQVID